MDNQTISKNQTCDHQIPLVTFALFAYNQEKYITEAIKGALNQDYPRLEIILSDDCSTDLTFAIIQSLASGYDGPHTIVTNRNPTNLGVTQHFNKIVDRARGEIVVVAAGDDISLPTRVSKTVEILNSDPETTIVSFTDIHIDSDGKEFPSPPQTSEQAIRKATLNDYIEGRSPFVSGASRGYKTKIFDVFGNLNPSCPTEDTPSLLRGLMVGHALISSQPGIYYRLHDSNLSRPQSLHSMKIDEIRNQYICDASLSLKENHISKNTFHTIEGWIEGNYQRRLLTAELYNASNKIRLFAGKLIYNKHFSFLSKGRIFINILLGRYN